MKMYMHVLRVSLFTVCALLPSIASASIDTNLRYGARGVEVTELQEFLIDGGFLTGAASGNFFALTRKAVILYQTSVGLPATGYVGPMTRQYINTALAGDVSSAAEVTETGTTTAPVTESATDLMKKQMDLLMKQLQVLQNQSNTQSQILNNQQSQQTTQTQQTQQIQNTLQQIQQNTAPTTVTQPTIPPVTKAITLTSNVSEIPLTNFHQASFSATYTEDGLPTTATLTLSISNGTISGTNNPVTVNCPSHNSGCKTEFTAKPANLGPMRITVIANGVSKSIDVMVIPYVKIDSKVSGNNLNRTMTKGNTGYSIGTLTFTGADETLQINSIALKSNATSNGSVTVRAGGIHSFTSSTPNAQGDASATATQTVYVSQGTELQVFSDAPFEPGVYTVTITGIDAYGQLSGMPRSFIGLPITFNFSVQ